jgi:hypothetical protein
VFSYRNWSRPSCQPGGQIAVPNGTLELRSVWGVSEVRGRTATAIHVPKSHAATTFVLV